MDPFCPAQKTSCKPPSVENARHHPCLTRRQFAVRGLGGGLQRKSTRSKVQISAVTRSFSAVQVQKLSIPATQCTLALLIAQCTQFALQCNRWIATGLGTQNLLRNTLARKSAKLNPVKRSAANILSDLFILAPRYAHCALCTVHTAANLDRASVLANGKSGRILSTTFLSHPFFSSSGMSSHPLLLGTQVGLHNRPQSKHKPLR